MDAKYFITKFEAIPEEQWTVGMYQDEKGRRCALGHCLKGQYEMLADENCRAESAALFKILYPLHPADVNDGKLKEYQQVSPKERILAALRDKISP